MYVEVTQTAFADAGADLVAVGLFEGDNLPAELEEAPGEANAHPAYKKLGLVYPEAPATVLVVGLGDRAGMSAERARVAAALALKEAGRLGARSLAWVVPESGDAEELGVALVTGTILAAYRFDRLQTAGDGRAEGSAVRSLTLIGPAEIDAAAQTARVAAEAQNRVRELQDMPANLATPAHLADRAEQIAAAHDSVEAEILDGDEISARGMGGLAAVAKGSDEDSRLIVLRYSGGGGDGALGLVGKGVTFDSGGISIKPSSGMQEMKMDMSGGAVVLETVAALAELDVPIDVVAVVPSTENMVSGLAIKPGDVITQYSGKTVEVNNTDAEGRLILADALAYCAELGATRIIDIATLTGAIEVALGSSFAGLVSNDDALAGEIEEAGTDTGELVWRLPLHPEYTELMKGKVADLSNLSSKRKAGALTAAAFLAEFVGDTPWAHLDIAGTSWDVGREYVGTGPSGFGARLLLAVASELAHRPAY